VLKNLREFNPSLLNDGTNKAPFEQAAKLPQLNAYSRCGAGKIGGFTILQSLTKN
jgi:hypothetical protein